MRRIGRELIVSIVPAVELTWARLHLQARNEENDDRPGLLVAGCGRVLRTGVAVVLLQDGGGAIGGAMIGAVDHRIPGALTLALESLNIACTDLDAAVLALPNIHGDDVVASASLIALLLRVVTARRHVKQLELDVKAEIGNRVRASTVS